MVGTVLGAIWGLFVPAVLIVSGLAQGECVHEIVRLRRAFGRLSAPESLFSCVAKRKVTKREGHPAWRLPGVGQLLLRCLNSGIHALAMPGKSVSRGRAFRPDIRQLLLRCSDSGIHAVACPDEKESTSLSTPAARPVDPVSPPHRGPGRAAGLPGPHSVKSRSKAKRCSGSSEKYAQEARCFTGAPLQRRVGGGTARRVAGRDAGQFGVSTGCAVDKPRHPPADLPGMARAWMPELRQRRSSCPTPGKRVSGVPCLFGYFLFEHAKRK